MAKFAVILPAAGKSNRFRDKEKKPFANMDGRAVWLRSAELFVTRSDVSQCLIIVAKEDQETFRRRYGANMAFMNIQIADGGAERHDYLDGPCRPSVGAGRGLHQYRRGNKRCGNDGGGLEKRSSHGYLRLSG